MSLPLTSKFLSSQISLSLQHSLYKVLLYKNCTLWPFSGNFFIWINIKSPILYFCKMSTGGKMCIRIVFSPAETAREKKEMKTYLAGRKVIGGIFFSFNVEREKSWCVSHYESLHMYSVLKNSKKGRSKYDRERQVTQPTSRQQSCR